MKNELNLPEESSCQVEIKTKRKPVWRLALFFWNGKKPVFAQYGLDVYDVTEWRYANKENAETHEIGGYDK